MIVDAEQVEFVEAGVLGDSPLFAVVGLQPGGVVAALPGAAHAAGLQRSHLQSVRTSTEVRDGLDVDTTFDHGRHERVSVGEQVDPKQIGPVPNNAIIVKRAPQLELLKRASVCITHAGLNTVLESLAQGVPQVAIPVTMISPVSLRESRTSKPV